MTTIYMDTGKHSDTQQLVKSAIDGEIIRLEMALEAAHRRLLVFEEKYGVTSEKFMMTLSAEDLEGQDDEYVQWAGEYQLWQRLQEKVNRLQGIEYRDSNILQPT